MAITTTAGTFKLTALINGSTFSSHIKSSIPLLQFWNGSSAVPSWEGNNGPTIELEVKNESGVVLTPYGEKLYYAGREVVFSSTVTNGYYYSSDGIFRKSVNSSNGHTAFQIIKNLASDSNTDNDVIYVTGKVNPSGNGELEVTSPATTIQIIQSGIGSAYLLSISGDDIAKGEETTTLTATVYSSDTGLPVTDSVSYQWYNMTAGAETPTVNASTNRQLVVPRDEVNGFELFKCTATVNGDSVSGYIQVRDFNDPYYIQIEIEGTSDFGYISVGDNAVVKANVVNSSGEAVAAPSGKVFRPEWSVVDAKGVSVNLAEKGILQSDGTLRFSYNQIIEFGGSIDGYVTGEFV